MWSTPVAVTGTVLAGLVAWSLGEYVIHRWLMHAPAGRGLPSREHLLHHADPEHNPGRPLLSWIGIVVVGAALFLVPGAVFLAPAAGAGLYAGWLAGYGTYERIHNRAHTHGPSTAYGRWVRRHHFHHHHGHPRTNHGVTSPLWDRVFGTYEPVAELRVPRRHAMGWLLDERGAVRPEYRSVYRLVGPSDPAGRLAALDRARAFANRTLVAG